MPASMTSSVMLLTSLIYMTRSRSAPRTSRSSQEQDPDVDKPNRSKTLQHRFPFAEGNRERPAHVGLSRFNQTVQERTPGEQGPSVSVKELSRLIVPSCSQLQVTVWLWTRISLRVTT